MGDRLIGLDGELLDSASTFDLLEHYVLRAPRPLAVLFQRPLRTSAAASHPDHKHGQSDRTRATGNGGGLGAAGEPGTGSNSRGSRAEQEQRAKGAKGAKRTSRLDVGASFSMHVIVHQATVLLMHRHKMFAFLRTSGVDLTSAGSVRVIS